ncbi:MAG: type IV pilus secretin PilQ [Thermodesulfobacteriota bacterium]|nr:type IV pilus secretin PilQ [Thermodesulfobacteriota bacterium]
MKLFNNLYVHRVVVPSAISAVRPAVMPLHRGSTPIMLVLISMMLALWGCAGKKETVQQQDFFDEWRAKAESAKGYSPAAATPAPPDQSIAETREDIIHQADVKPAYKLGAHDNEALTGLSELPDSPVTIKMTNTDISVLLRALAKAAGKNIVISANVGGMANINAENVPWNEAFASLLRTHGLTYNLIGDTLRIKTLADIQQDFKIENEYRKQQEERILTKVFFLKYSDAEEVVAFVKPMLSQDGAGGGGKSRLRHGVAVDKRNNAVIIHSTAANIEQSGKLIAQIDRPTRQVLIEAQIVETSKDTARQLGVQWGGVALDEYSASRNGWIKGGTQGSTGTNLFDSSGTPQAANPSSGWASNFPANMSATGLSLGYIYEDLGQSLIATQLTALEEDGKLNILSTPSITTLDNSAAIIESGRDVPFQTVEDNEVKIEWKKAVLSLEVTPHIIDANTLRVQIKTNKDELDWSNAALTDGNPTIITKNAETDMILFDGQTTVIGGLNKQTNSDSELGIPFLKDIPLLGFLFRSTDRSNDMEEVLIFITPHILEAYHGEGTDTGVE